MILKHSFIKEFKQNNYIISKIRSSGFFYGHPLIVVIWLSFTYTSLNVIHDHAVDAQDTHHGCGQGTQRQAGGDVQDGEEDAQHYWDF